MIILILTIYQAHFSHIRWFKNIWDWLDFIVQNSIVKTLTSIGGAILLIIGVLYLKIPACDILIPYLSKLPQSVVGNVKVSAQTATILKMILMVSIAALCGFKTPRRGL